MKKLGLIYCLLLAVVLSSACTTLNDFASPPEPKNIVEEGHTLVYQDNSGQRFEIVFFNETERSIGVHFASGRDNSTINVSKTSWVSDRGLADEFFFSGAFTTMNQSKFSSLMEEGQQISSEGQAQISRSDRLQWKGFQAYNVTLEEGEKSISFIVHAKEPYLIMLRPGSHELISVNETGTLEQYQIRTRATKAQKALQKIQSTELEISTASRNGEQIRLHLRNVGKRTVNLQEFKVYYGPPNWEAVRFSMLQSRTDWTIADQNCFTENRILEPANRYSCDTGVKYPETDQEVEIEVMAKEFDYDTSYTCSPVTEGSRTC